MQLIDSDTCCSFGLQHPIDVQILNLVHQEVKPWREISLLPKGSMIAPWECRDGGFHTLRGQGVVLGRAPRETQRGSQGSGCSRKWSSGWTSKTEESSETEASRVLWVHPGVSCSCGPFHPLPPGFMTVYLAPILNSWTPNNQDQLTASSVIWMVNQYIILPAFQGEETFI